MTSPLPDTLDLTELDLADPALYETELPEQVWAELRRRGVPHWNAEEKGPGFWVITKYDHALAVYKGTHSFSSERGMMLGTDRAAAAAAAGAAAGKMLIVTDPPRHARLRQIVNAAFAPRSVERLVDIIRATAVELLEDVVDAGPCDFVRDVAARLPVAVICQILHVPRADWDLMVDLTSTAFGGVDVSDPASVAAQAQAHADIFYYYTSLVAERRRNPGDDVVSALASGVIDGVPITDEEAVLNCHGFITGGNETTRHASSYGLRALVDNPWEWERLRGDASLVPTLVEEILRWSSPGMHILRTATRDVEIGGAQIEAGEAVTIWNPSANRDEDAFVEPERFLIDRNPNRHLTFGIGEHFCLGGPLARVELRVLFEEIRSRVATIELLGEPRRLRSNFLRGFVSMPAALSSR
jgi:cytochrome P450